MNREIKQYMVVTGTYWAFTITDGALRMLVLLFFYEQGYSPMEIALLFLLYEFFGVVTNLVGGWIGARIGLDFTTRIGIILQIIALGMLTAEADWLTVPYVMAAQAISGIAVVAIPVYFQAVFHWSHTQVGTFMAAWIIGYGCIQSIVPSITGNKRSKVPDGKSAFIWAISLTCQAEDDVTPSRVEV